MLSLGAAIAAILHLDTALAALVQSYGAWVYAILFAIIFLETGIVIAPFLPGDSLLFAAGALAALGGLNPWLLFGALALAAILGDALNYAIGAHLGRRAFTSRSRFLSTKRLHEAERFYERHGAKTIFIARFVPVVRTFAPFVAGIGEMSYARFAAYNVAGAIAWTGLFVAGGYWLGNVALVKAHFTLFLLAIIALSLVPVLAELVRHRTAGRKSRP